MLAYIWAEDLDGHIGKDGHLPWHLPADLAYFKQRTLGHPILMGRKTFASFPGMLPHRLHLVLTRNAALKEKARVTDNLEVFMTPAEMKAWITAHPDEDIFVIGGASLFTLLKDEVDTLYQTVIKAHFDGDVTMPAINYRNFDLISVQSGQVDEKNQYPYEFRVYQCKPKDSI